jgi:hypothetical protein
MIEIIDTNDSRAVRNKNNVLALEGPCQRVLAGTPRPSAISGAENKGSQGAAGNYS